MKLIFEHSRPGRRGYTLPPSDVPEKKPEDYIPAGCLRRDELELPEVGELDIVRHYTNVSARNVGVDTVFYPLGSCTMKYNPKINEVAAALPHFTRLHPYQPEGSSQGILEVMYNLQEYFKEISGMDAVSLQPAAGAHGELAALLVMKAFLDENRGRRTKVLIPDSAHGTNPASSIYAGFETVQIKSNDRGLVDLEDLKKHTDETTAVLMLTNPNTLGLFEDQVQEIARILHDEGALLYVDGANLNAIMGITRPADFGADALHFNLHKTYATPHGGGGPGSGPIGVVKDLADYLPAPVVVKEGGKLRLNYDIPKSIGRVRSFYGNVGVMVKAYAYLRMLGREGVPKVSQHAVLNANYLAARLKKHFWLPYDRICMHECVFSGNRQKKHGVKTLDIAKRLLDLGFHPPTIYFPLIVSEAIMTEPTENESKETLDAFADAMIQIAREAEESPDVVTSAPQNMPVKRLDEAKAVKEPCLRWNPE